MPLTTARPRLVMLRALGLGDFLAGVPAYRAIARAFPAHHRMLAAPAVLAPLARLAGDIDEVVDTKPLAPLDPVLHGADVAINLHGCGPQSHRLLLETEPRKMMAFGNAEARFEGPAWQRDEHEIERWCRMLEAFGIAADPRDLDIHIDGSSPRVRGAILLHPGASSESRCWPVSRWIELASRLRVAGHTVALTGGVQEFRRARLIARNTGVPIDYVLAGKTSLEELVRVVASARLVVCGDTGVAHVATAVGTPSIVLFGPVSPQQWGPPPQRTRHRVLWRGDGRGDPHASACDPSLAAITVDDVMREIAALRDLHIAV